ncbi:MAG: hypothetical protein K6L60_04770 [Oceanobacter sp.]
MLHDALLVGMAVVLLVILIVVGRMWVGRSWFVQWLKGTAGMIMLFAGALLSFVLVDIWTYHQAESSTPVATVSVYELDPQLFDVTLVDPEGVEQRFQLRGDQWQLDMRLMTWIGPVSQLGAAPMYRFDRLLGRYLSLEQERTAERTLYSLSKSEWIDSWAFLKTKNWWLNADYGSAVFMPMVNGAVYSVFIGPSGVRAEPMNNVAERALGGNW